MSNSPAFAKAIDETSNIEQPQALLVTVKQAAVILSLSRSSIYLLVEAGTLKPVRIGRSVRFSMADLEAFVENLSSGETCVDDEVHAAGIGVDDRVRVTSAAYSSAASTSSRSRSA